MKLKSYKGYKSRIELYKSEKGDYIVSWSSGYPIPISGASNHGSDLRSAEIEYNYHLPEKIKNV